jgi:hypothetical protein
LLTVLPPHAHEIPPYRLATEILRAQDRSLEPRLAGCGLGRETVPGRHGVPPGYPTSPDRNSHAVCTRLAGGRANRPISFGIGAEPGHHEHRKPSTSVPMEASGWRSTVLTSIALQVRQPGQKTLGAGGERRADRGRPRYVAAEGESVIPALNDGFGLGARGLVGGVADGDGLHVQSPRPNPHGGPHSDFPARAVTSSSTSS